MATTDPETGYAPANGLEMYYEIHGTGRAAAPAARRLHDDRHLGPILPSLAEHRQVIAVELQGHGHTADIDRPLTYEQMADDAAALLAHLGIEQVDVVGYSMGAGVALQLAIRHPALVRKLVVASGSYTSDGMHAEALEMFPRSRPRCSPVRRWRRRICAPRRTPPTSRRWSTS